MRIMRKALSFCFRLQGKVPISSQGHIQQYYASFKLQRSLDPNLEADLKTIKAASCHNDIIDSNSSKFAKHSLNKEILISLNKEAEQSTFSRGIEEKRELKIQQNSLELLTQSEGRGGSNRTSLEAKKHLPHVVNVNKSTPHASCKADNLQENIINKNQVT